METDSATGPPARGACPITPADLHEAIRRRAEEIYIRGGRIPGRDLDNWAMAEVEILGESAKTPAHRTAIAVTVNGVKYVGEYDRGSSGDYKPGEFKAGGSVVVRFDGDKMFVKRSNGKELETRIVCAVGN